MVGHEAGDRHRDSGGGRPGRREGRGPLVAELAYRAERAKQPDRSAPRPRQWLLAGAALALDGVACVFAAEALDGSQLETYGWAGLFLARLLPGSWPSTTTATRTGRCGGGFRGHPAAFIGLLGVLRFVFLTTVGYGGDLAALVRGHAVHGRHGGLVVAGYRLLRAARLVRRGAPAGCGATASGPPRPPGAGSRPLRPGATGWPVAYLSRIRSQLARSYSASELPLMEQALMAHLTGQELAR